ncbi:stage II sporulation protein R [Natronospora cellulosivora (SeqCode)]
MKKIRILLFVIFLSIILMSLNVNSAIVLKQSSPDINAFKNNNLLRFHVIANSNTAKDQYIKRKIRDEVITYMEKYSGMTYADFVCDIDDLNDYVNKILKDEGLNYKATLQLGTYNFPTRTYDELSLKAGQYKALRILLGQAEGTNWWCVLLPPLCVDNVEKESVDEDSIETTWNNVEFRFKFLEWFKQNENKSSEEENKEDYEFELLNILQEKLDLLFKDTIVNNNFKNEEYITSEHI